MKIRPSEAQVFRTDRRTDMTTPILAFINFANAPDNSIPQNFRLSVQTNVHSMHLGMHVCSHCVLRNFTTYTNLPSRQRINRNIKESQVEHSPTPP